MISTVGIQSLILFGASISSVTVLLPLIVWRKTGNRLHLLQVPSGLMVLAAFTFLYQALLDTVDIGTGLVFYSLYSLVYPALIFWAEEFTRRMERISKTADFELGLPFPSKSYQLLGVFCKMVQELAKPILTVRGTKEINQKISNIAEREHILGYIQVKPDGSLQVNNSIISQYSATKHTQQAFLQLLDFLIEQNYLLSGRVSREEFEVNMKERFSGFIHNYSDLLIEYGLLDRIGDGIFSDRISTGLTDFDLTMDGGYPEHAGILVCGPPSDERNLLLNSFIGTGLEKGDPCLYVSSAQPPENVISQFGRLGSRLKVVDCYSNRIREISTITQEGNTITSPIEISVVSVAISRVLEREKEKTKRAVVDILPTYLVFQTVEKLYLDLMEIIDELRRAGYTTLFSLNPYYIKDEGAISTLQELFDGIIYVERTADSSGMRNEISIRVDKMAGNAIAKSEFKIAKPSSRSWKARGSVDLSATADRLPSEVEA